jgi:PEP-CTERM motif
MMFRASAVSNAIAMLIAAATSFWAVPASAVTIVPDTFATYNVSGSFENLIDPLITGTLTVDLTTHKVTAADINTGSISRGGFGTFTQVGFQTTTFGQDYFVLLSNGAGTTFDLILDTTSTLFGGKTTKIDPNSNFFFALPFGGAIPCFVCDDFTGSLTISESGSGTGVAAAVPEPSTWAMMILGFLGIGFLASRRSNGVLRLA